MRLLTTLLVASALILAGPALAGKKNKSNGKANQPTTAENVLTKAVIGGLITIAERAVVGEYLDRNRSAFAGAQPLPPGIAKKVERGGALPPGIAKKTLPTGLLAQLRDTSRRILFYIEKDGTITNTRRQRVGTLD